MGEGECSPGPWKAIENSWQYTTIYDAHDHEICRLDLERFEDLNEETQDKYEAIQRADAAAIVLACDHDAALRRAKAEGLDEALKLCAIIENHYATKGVDERVAKIQQHAVAGVRQSIIDHMAKLDARPAQIENEATK